MRLRARLSAWFALFAAIPLLAVLLPVSLVLRRSLARDHAARLDAAARAIDGELLRQEAAVAEAVRDLAAGPELAALAGALERGEVPTPDAAARLSRWGAARGLDVLSLCEPGGRVVASGHLPGRAGDVDPSLARLLAAAPRGRVVPIVVARAGLAELVRSPALAAWSPVPGTALLAAGGSTLGQPLAERLATLTGGAILVRDGAGAAVARAGPPSAAEADERGTGGLADFLAAPLAAGARTVTVGPGPSPVASLEVTLPAGGLVRTQLAVLAAFVGLLLAAVLAAAAVGRFLARRETGPIEALRAAAVRVAGGDLEARVGIGGAGELGELVRAFDSMTAELARSRSRLAAAERVAAWREVARALAHELKNPLTPIAMSVETLRDARDRADFPEILEESTRAIGEEVRRLKRIVDEFGRFARLPDPELARVPAGELAGGLLALYPAAPPGVELVRAIAPDLPDVRADRDQILQVLHNLVKNALEAMPAGGRLTVEARRDGAEVAFEIADTGPGIPPALRERIFQPYVTTKAGGTGLGLAIAERIVQEHGGRIEVGAAPGGGALFSVRLPVVG